MEKKQIPCKVCGKMFTPCAFCMSHADTFRWRNFACSIECARKYIAEAETYRAKNKTNEKPVEEVEKPKKADKNIIKDEKIELAVTETPSFEEVNGDVVKEEMPSKNTFLKW